MKSVSTIFSLILLLETSLGFQMTSSNNDLPSTHRRRVLQASGGVFGLPFAFELKERLGKLFAEKGVHFQISAEGPSLFKFLTGRGRIGRRFGSIRHGCRIDGGEIGRRPWTRF